VLFVLASCFNKGDCLKTNTDKVRIAFKKKSDGKQDTVVIKSIVAEGFSNVYKSDTTLSGGTFSLQVNPNQTQTNFIFNYTYTRNKKDSTRTDTLKLTYRPLARVPASDCGAFLYFTDLNYVKTGFDSIRIVNSQLLSDATIVNVQIYR
jgi:uncharacterized protein YyaL (SSP411 family)